MAVQPIVVCRTLLSSTVSAVEVSFVVVYNTGIYFAFLLVTFSIILSFVCLL